jgi:tetratricopeptide (TPR) repeat protein
MTSSFRDENQKIIKKIISLARSDSYIDWYKAVAIIQKYLPENITSFDDADFYFDLPHNGIYLNDLLYELEEELQNDGLDDLNLLVKRAKLARWVYKLFSNESELNLGNFRNFEAESLWELDKVDEAESCFQELIKTFPEFTFGYIHYGDCYIMSDWSYKYGPDYERAEIVYRMALEKPDLNDIEVVKDRLKELLEEKEKPEIRESRQSFRLKRIQERTQATNLDELDDENLLSEKTENDVDLIINDPIISSEPVKMEKAYVPVSSKAQKNKAKAKRKKLKQAKASRKKNRR